MVSAKTTRLLAFGDADRQESGARLKLVLLWNADDEMNYTGLDIVCPRGERRDGSVDCFWETRWASAPISATTSTPAGTGSGDDLDEIKPVSVPKTSEE